MGRKSLKQTRQLQIIKAFYKLAKKEGYENTSIAKIANAMGVNPSLILHYFSTKEDLTYGLIDYILERYLMIFPKDDQEEPGLDLLKKTIDMLFSKKWNFLFDDGLFYTFYAISFRDKRIQKKYKAILDALRHSLSLIIKQCDEKQLLKVSQPEIVSDFIFVLVDGAYFYMSTENDRELYEDRLNFYKKEAYRLLGLNYSDIPVLTLSS